MKKQRTAFIPIVRLRKYWYIFSGLLMATTIALVATGGLKLGIDFAGGSIHEISFTQERPSNDEIRETLAELTNDPVIQPSGDTNVILRYQHASNQERQAILTALNDNHGEVSEERFESIGPTIGNELKQKAFYAIGLVILAIILYLTYAFRKVSEPVKSWKYGILAIVTLIHDVVIVVGVFAVLGHLRNAQIDSLFLIALLTTLGYSVHDTIVVFDRTRTNLIKFGGSKFEYAVSLATNQTLSRSINTSATTALPLVALLLFGGSTIHNFVIALLVGVLAGTYSSIFIASPLLVTWHRWSSKRHTA